MKEQGLEGDARALLGRAVGSWDDAMADISIEDLEEALGEHHGVALLASKAHKIYQFGSIKQLRESVIKGEENSEAIFILTNIAGHHKDTLCLCESGATDLVVKSSAIGVEISGWKQGVKNIEVAGGSFVQAQQWLALLPTITGSHLQTNALEMTKIIDPIKKVPGLDTAINKLYDEFKQNCWELGKDDNGWRSGCTSRSKASSYQGSWEAGANLPV